MYSVLFNNINTILDEILVDSTNLKNYTPAQVYNIKNGKMLVLEAPGFGKDDLKVEIENNQLKIYGEKVFSFDEKNTTTRKLNKTYNLGDSHNFDLNNCEAEMKDGMLTVKLFELKKQEKKKIISLI